MSKSKAERLFDLVMLLRGKRAAVTALDLARRFEVSERTIYRDLAALAESGIPVEGEAGVGYRLGRNTHLAPLMFTPDEAIAIALGLQFVRAFTDSELGAAADRAGQRVRAVLPDETKLLLERMPYRIPVLERDAPLRDLHAALRRAADAQKKLRIEYRDEQGNHTRRVIWPLALMGWGGRWTVLAWSEERRGYRNFRIDRIIKLEQLAQHFETSETLSIAHYYRTELGIDDIA
ncbi:MAG: helix-turn-helix transcriptional regulator [Devosia sp.]